MLGKVCSVCEWGSLVCDEVSFVREGVTCVWD